ncbi:TPA: hypothetical protein DCG35_08295 [Candidatus Edwardsbacteria bacterium]|nr:hypothetical protein [Candidatus Edwardsbacteria bacterium]HBZ85687.1 hypothetical protein [Candidatus Edwardsbacteria bacterium]
MIREYYFYILSNKWITVLYTGVTNNLKRRVAEHKQKTELIICINPKYIDLSSEL